MPRPFWTRDRLLFVLSDGSSKSHREIIKETGLSESSVWNGLKRCWEAGLILRTKSALYEGGKVFRGRAGSVQTTRPYHLYMLNLFYTATVNGVIPRWREWEKKNYLLQPAVEKTALELYKEDAKLACSFLTTYCCAKANEALDIAEELTEKLNTIISHYNSPL